MVGNVPGILPKTALVGSRAVYYPFTIPKKLNDSATITGAALNGMVAGINSSVKSAYEQLQPRGPAKWLLPLFDKVDHATTHSSEIAQRNKTVFWDPFSEGMEQVGRAFASPGTYWYLKKAGVEQPTQDQIKSVLNMPFFKFPDGAEVGGGMAPEPEAGAAEAVAASAAAEQAAEGAGEVAAAA